jgi:hypothetical protein
VGGRVASPLKYFIGEDNFNSELAEAGLLLVDDETFAFDHRARNRLKQNLKQHVAASGFRIRGMHRSAVMISPIQGTVICSNLGESLQVLPPLSEDFEDKILALVAHRAELDLPWDLSTREGQLAFRAELSRELPAFAHFLLHEWTAPEGLTGRFGCAAWAHPLIRQELAAVEFSARVLEFLERFLETGPRVLAADLDKISAADAERLAPRLAAAGGSLIGFVGTVSDIRNQLLDDSDEAFLKRHERDEILRRATPFFGRDLSALSRIHPVRFWQSRSRSDGARTWIILPKQEAQA